METATSIESAVGGGVSELMRLGPIVTLETLVLIVLCYFIRELLRDAKTERQLNREALNNSTAILAEIKGTLNAILNNFGKN